MKKTGHPCKDIACMYLLCSLAAFVFLVFAAPLSYFLLLLGSNSVFIAFGVFCAAAVSQFGGICSFTWLVCLPIALLATYIAVIKEHYLPFWVLMMMDVVAVLVWIVYAMFDHNLYGALAALPDLVVSTILVCIYKYKMHH